MVKKILVILMLSIISPLFCACGKESIVTATGNLGRRADAYKKYLPARAPASNQTTNGRVIYLGKDYENNHFGPTGIKFVFEK